jgi:multicomponent Na+:H+ antiporter subunit E
MNLFLLNILLALIWVALTGYFIPTNVVIGFLLAYIVLWLVQRTMEPSSYFVKMHQLLGFILFFIWELIKANLRVAYDVLTPRHHMRPGVVAVPLDAKTDLEIMLLSSLITLTPGTLSLDVSGDRRVLYIHAMYITDIEAFRQEIKTGMERRLLEVLR